MQNKSNLRISIIEAKLPQLFIVVGLFLVLYYNSILRIIGGWFTQESSYGLLIFAICLYMIWIKRHALVRIEVQSKIIYGTLLCAFAGFIFIAGQISSTLLLVDLSLVINLLGLIWLLLGTRFLAALFVPISYLILMMSFFEEILNNFSIYLQYISAWIACLLLRMIGVSVYLHGQFLEMPHITLEVAKVCSGINHIIALVALSVPLAVSTRYSWIKKSLIVVAAFAIGIFANGLRVAMIGVWTKYNPSYTSIHGPFEIFFTSFIVVFGLAMIYLALSLTNRLKRNTDNDTESVVNTQKSKTFFFDYFRSLASKISTKAFVTSIVLLSLLLAYSYLYVIKPVDLSYPLNTFPTQIGEWMGKDIKETSWPIDSIKPDEKIHRIYRNAISNTELELTIGYFSSQTQERELVQYKLERLHEFIEVKEFRHNEDTININLSLPDKSQRIFYFWYVIDGHVYTGRYRTKLAVMIQSFFKRRNNGAIVLISVDRKSHDRREVQNEIVRFIEQAFPAISHILN